MFLGIIIGVILYMLLLSSYIIKTSVYIINIVKKLFTFITKVIIYPISVIAKFIKKIFIRPITFLFINFKKLAKNSIHPFIKIAKKAKILKNNAKILKNKAKKEGI